MSVRRLASAAEQPDSFAFNKKSEEICKFWLAKYPEEKKASAVIPFLWIAQKQEGWVPEPALRLIAERLEMPYIRVYEVATFYTMFNLAPAGEHLIQVCGTTPCWLRGSDALIETCKSRIGKAGQVRQDGKFSWMEVECLGSCATAPMVQVSNTQGDHYFEDLDAESFGKVLDALEKGETPDHGSQTGRKASEPVGADVLTDPALYDGSAARPVKLPDPKKAEG